MVVHTVRSILSIKTEEFIQDLIQLCLMAVSLATIYSIQTTIEVEEAHPPLVQYNSPQQINAEQYDVEKSEITAF